MTENWININDRPIEWDDNNVLAYNAKWISEYNPTGVRIGFIGAKNIFCSAEWNEEEGDYERELGEPTHYLLITPPQT